MSVRFPDSMRVNNAYEKSAPSSDFVMRKNMPILQILVVMVGGVALVLFMLSLMFQSVSDFSKIIFVICVALGTYGVFYLQNSRDIALYAEFLNALFSSALAHSNKFCIILKNDGAITYFNS
jgi:hypothetical protein